jgi:hypothetical protein
MSVMSQVSPDEKASLDLLAQWYAWWFASDEAPPKMPDALHIKTALFLMENGYSPLPPGLQD